MHAPVNDAGTLPKGLGGSRLNSLETDIVTQLSMYKTNFSALLLTRGIAPELSKARGVVVNLTSITTRRVHKFAGSARGAWQAALTAVMRKMGFDLARVGVRIDPVSPGKIDAATLSAESHEIVDRDIPMHRLRTIGEVADVVWFLCLSQATYRYITAAEVPINGGQHV